MSIKHPSLTMELPFPFGKRVLQWEDAKLDKLAEGQMLAGMNYTRQDPAPVIIDLNRRTTAHILISGATGSGKTNEIGNQITSLCLSTPADRIQIVFCDPKGDIDWSALADFPQVTMYRGDEGCANAILSVKAELDRRKDAHDKRKILLFIDEYAELLTNLDKATKDRVEAAVQSVSQIGRSLNVHLALCTQKPVADVVDSVAKGNLTTRIGHAVTTREESRVAMGRDGIGCELLGDHPGAFYAIIAGSAVQRGQSYLMTDDALDGAIMQAERRNAQIDPFRIPMQDVPQEGNDRPLLRVADEETVLAGRLMMHYGYSDLFDNESQLLPGVRKSEIIRAVFGDDANTGGSNWHKIDRVLAKAATMREAWSRR